MAEKIKIQTIPPDNKYERVLVAAKEARRLNEWDQQLMDRPYRRICEEAVSRTDGGQVKYTYDPPTNIPAPAAPNPLLAPIPPSGLGDGDEE